MEFSKIRTFLDYWERSRGRTLRVAECIPHEQIEWRHRAGAFSFGDLLRHLAAAERYMFTENARLRPSRYPGHGREPADGYTAVLRSRSGSGCARWSSTRFITGGRSTSCSGCWRSALPLCTGSLKRKSGPLAGARSGRQPRSVCGSELAQGGLTLGKGLA